jgi:hypothetical protein
MFQLLLTRPPKESEMALSNQVKESVNQAAVSLREGLAFASRSEHPMLIATLADLIVRLESLESMDEAMAMFGSKQSAKMPDIRLGPETK